MNPLETGQEIAELLQRTVPRVGIYDDLSDRPMLIYSKGELEAILGHRLAGLCLDYPIRTRSKVVKEAVCRALGYEPPSSFSKVRPRFLAQGFDVYVQKANNLQIWNEEISPNRRYVLIRVDAAGSVTKVRVVLGTDLAVLDTTGKLTKKFQAKAKSRPATSRLVSVVDTASLLAHVANLSSESPISPSRFLTIRALYQRLVLLVGQKFKNPGHDQERLRGATLHAIVQKALGEDDYRDNGQIPDVPAQLLELKLQTGPTIDLGLFSPDDGMPVSSLGGVRHSDIRYAVFYATNNGDSITLDNVIVSTGADFFTCFNKFGGLGVNAKLQIPLPGGFL